MSNRIDELHKVVDRLSDCVDSCATAIGQHLEKIEQLTQHQKGLARANNCNGDIYFSMQKQMKILAHAHDVVVEILDRDTEFDTKSYDTCVRLFKKTEAKAHLESCLDPDWDKPTEHEQ